MAVAAGDATIVLVSQVRFRLFNVLSANGPI